MGKTFTLLGALAPGTGMDVLNWITFSRSSLKKSSRSILVTTSRPTVISSSNSTCNLLCTLKVNQILALNNYNNNNKAFNPK
jgi:hypothetical protein